MREIKFRAWDRLEKKMWVPDAIQNGGRPMKVFPHHPQYTEFPLQEADPIMQFTGLKDKNRKEIYEGDIVKAFDLIYDIRFGEARNSIRNLYWQGWYMVCHNEPGPKHPEKHYCIPFNTMAKTDYEVIGNIYENSNLIKENKK